MTPAKKSSLVNLAAFAGALVAVAGIAAVPARALDGRYVHTDQFRVQYVTDSLTYLDHLRSIDERMARIDSAVRCLAHPKQPMCQ